MSSSASRTGPSALALIERGAWAGFLLGLLVAGLMVSRNRLLPLEHPLTFGLAFWIAFEALYLPIGVACGVLAALVSRLTRRPLLASVGLCAAALLGLVTLLGSNRRALRMLLDVEGPWRHRVLLPAAVVLAVAGLVTLVSASLRAQRVLRASGLLAGVALLAALWPAPRATSAPTATPVIEPGPLSALPPLLVIGLDGADWRYVEPLMAKGELPNLKALRERGASGPLATLKPTLSPVIWTTIATGQPEHQHGVSGFRADRLSWVEQSLPDLHPPNRAGFGLVQRRLEAHGIWRQSPITSHARRVPAFWNLAAQARSPIAVLGWWATWPVEPVFGYMVSERAYYYGQDRSNDPAHADRMTFPGKLFGELAPAILRYEQVALDEARAFMDVEEVEFTQALRVGRGSAMNVVAELPYFLSLFETNRRHAHALIERGRRDFKRVPDLLVLFRLVDQVCHTALRYSDMAPDALGASDEERRRFGQAVAEAYRRADAVVGELVAECGPGCNVVVLSDHGFALESYPGGLRKYNHSSAPAGIFLGAGPAFRHAAVQDLGVLDMFPLMAYLKGVPLASDLKGRLPEEALDPQLLAQFPARSVPSYGTRARPSDMDAGSGALDDAMIERLKALGYVQ